MAELRDEDLVPCRSPDWMVEPVTDDDAVLLCCPCGERTLLDLGAHESDNRHIKTLASEWLLICPKCTEKFYVPRIMCTRIRPANIDGSDDDDQDDAHVPEVREPDTPGPAGPPLLS